MKIFWSWQSDTPGKIGRFVIRDALQDAIQELKQAPDIEEPTAQATREGLHRKGKPSTRNAVIGCSTGNNGIVPTMTTTALDQMRASRFAQLVRVGRDGEQHLVRGPSSLINLTEEKNW